MSCARFLFVRASKLRYAKHAELELCAYLELEVDSSAVIFSLLMLPSFNLQNTQIIGLSYRSLCEDERSTAGILYRSDWQITVSSTRFANLLPDDACEQLWQHAVLCATWPRRNRRDALSIWSLRCSLAIQAYQSSHGSLGQTVGRLGLAIAGSIGGNRFPFLSKFVQVGQLWSSFVLWVKCCVALQPLCRTHNNILSWSLPNALSTSFPFSFPWHCQIKPGTGQIRQNHKVV